MSSFWTQALIKLVIVTIIFMLAIILGNKIIRLIKHGISKGFKVNHKRDQEIQIQKYHQGLLAEKKALQIQLQTKEQKVQRLEETIREKKKKELEGQKLFKALNAQYDQLLRNQQKTESTINQSSKEQLEDEIKLLKIRLKEEEQNYTKQLKNRTHKYEKEKVFQKQSYETRLNELEAKLKLQKLETDESVRNLKEALMIEKKKTIALEEEDRKLKQIKSILERKQKQIIEERNKREEILEKQLEDLKASLIETQESLCHVNKELQIAKQHDKIQNETNWKEKYEKVQNDRYQESISREKKYKEMEEKFKQSQLNKERLIGELLQVKAELHKKTTYISDKQEEMEATFETMKESESIVEKYKKFHHNSIFEIYTFSQFLLFSLYNLETHPKLLLHEASKEMQEFLEKEGEAFKKKLKSANQMDFHQKSYFNRIVPSSQVKIESDEHEKTDHLETVEDEEFENPEETF